MTDLEAYFEQFRGDDDAPCESHAWALVDVYGEIAVWVCQCCGQVWYRAVSLKLPQPS